MAHTTEVTEYRQLSNGQFAVCVRCCGNDTHKSWHTVDAVLINQPEQLEQSLADHHRRVAAMHDAAVKAEAHFTSLVGTSKQHDV